MRRPAGSFRDAIERVVVWCDRARAMVHDVDFDAFVRDEKVQFATSKCVEQIGEAARCVIRDHGSSADEQLSLPLRAAYGMRNRLAHAYDDVDLAALWVTAREDAPSLALELRAVLERLPPNEP